MNQVYKTVWNKSLNCTQVTSELKTGHSRGQSTASKIKSNPIIQTCFSYARLSLLTFALLPTAIWASLYDVQLPTGGQVTVGAAEIKQSHDTLNIHQATQNTSIQWDQFNIGQKSTVNFYQPNSSSIAVNRVLDNNASQIMGKLNANGQVFLLNPNGVIFSKTAQINVGGIVASTLDLQDSDIMSGNFTLKNAGNAGNVENYGSIIANGGAIAFIAPTVINEGHVQSDNGVIHFTAADQVTLRLQDGDLTEYRVDIGTVQGLIDNSGAVLANNGAIYLTAKAKNSLSKSIVNHSGIVEANRLTKNAKGEIILLSDMAVGTTSISGSLSAQGENGQDGGFIETSAANVQVADNTKVSTQSDQGKTGNWLIDPTDFTIYGGSAAATSSGIAAKTLENNLQNTSVQLQTQNSGTEAGDIHVNAAVTWNKDTTLTLKAHNDIHINADITAQHQKGKVALIYGQNDQQDANYHLADGKKINLQAGQNFSTQKGTDSSQHVDYTVITELGAEGSYSATDLQGINGDLAGNYVLGADIDANDTAQWGTADDAGFLPIGNEFDGAFTGQFDGLGHSVSNLSIERPYSFGVGLFGFIEDASVRHVGVTSGSVRGDSFVGGLVGQSTNSLIQNSFSQADVHGYGTVGGLVGGNYDGKIQDSYATGDVTGDAYSAYVGGLVGGNDNAHIENSYATGDVVGEEIVGGLVGDNNNNSSIERSYATGDVSGLEHIGGLVGNSYYGSSIKDTYATGSVTGDNVIGGLVAENLASEIHTSYAKGKVSAQNTLVGGLVAKNTQGSISNSIWDKDQTDQSASAGSDASAGLDHTEMFDEKNYTGFDFDQVWGNAEDQTTGYLQQHKGQNKVSLKDDPSGQAYTVIQNVEQLQNVNLDLNGHYLLGNDIDASITQTWGDSTGNGFNPLGQDQNAFKGSFNGLGNHIADLYIDRPDLDQVALIAQNQGQVSAVGVVNANITGQNDVGALIGHNLGQIDAVYSSGDVRGQSNVGGLIGHNQSDVAEVYSQANVQAQSNGGGLIGLNDAKLQDVYSTGDVSGAQRVGGLVGYNLQNSTIDRVFSTGKITGTSSTGALIGQNDGTIKDAYWNQELNPTATAIGTGSGTAQGLTEAQIKDAASYSFLNEDSKLGGKDTVWRIYDGLTAPLLRQFLTTIDLSLRDKTATYSGKEQSFAEILKLDPSKYVAAGQTSGTDAGEYKATYYSNNQQGYDFIGNEGTLVIDKAAVTVRGSSETDKIYNGKQQVMQNPEYTVEGMVNGENEALLGSITVSGASGKDAGSYVNKLEGENNETKNYTINYEDGAFVINKKQINITATDEVREYNGALQAITGFIADGLVEGEDESVLTNINSLATRKDAGTYVHAVGFKNNQLGEKNYTVAKWQNGKITITKANATVKADDLTSIYNGENQSLSGFKVSGLKGNDQAGVLGQINNVAATGRNVGDYENQVTGAESVTNYNIIYENGNLKITPKELTATITAHDKVYDATTDAVTLGQLNGAIVGDDLDFNTTGKFADKNAEKNKTVKVTGKLVGADAGNYNLQPLQQQTQADITQRELIGSITAQDKVYNGTTDVIITGQLSGEISGDDVQLGTSGQFADKNAGEDKVVDVTGSLVGADAKNYILRPLDQIKLRADITKKELVGTITVKDKIYDATTDANITGQLSGVIAGDNVNLTTSGEFADKNAGKNKDVDIKWDFIGTDANNYSLRPINQTQAQADILKAQATVKANDLNTTYNGNNQTVSGFTTDGLKGNDQSTVLGQINNVGATGRDAGRYNNIVTGANSSQNYNIVYESGILDIAKKELDVIITAKNKIYDGNTSAELTHGAISGLFKGDDVQFNASGKFTDKNAGLDKIVNVSGILTGVDSFNYTLITNSRIQADILQKSIVGNISALNKVYDGTIQATVNGKLTGVIRGDDVRFISTGKFADKNAGLDKIVNVSGNLKGADAINYQLVNNLTTNATIDKAALEAIANSLSTTYTGKQQNVSGFKLNGLVDGDDTSQINLHASVKAKDAGTYINKVTGTADNYDLTFVDGVLNIDKAQATVTANSLDTVYNGELHAVSDFSVTGLVNNESAADLTNISVRGTGENAGTYKTTASGTDKNYDLKFVDGVIDIAKRKIDSVDGLSAINRNYDATKNVEINHSKANLVGMIDGDDLYVNQAQGHVSDKHVGQNKAVQISDITLAGTDASNYELINPTAQNTVNITKAVISQINGLVMDEQSKTIVYTPNSVLKGAFKGDDVYVDQINVKFEEVPTGSIFIDKNQLSLAGADAKNYQFVDGGVLAQIYGSTALNPAHYAKAIQNARPNYFPITPLSFENSIPLEEKDGAVNMTGIQMLSFSQNTN